MKNLKRVGVISLMVAAVAVFTACATKEHVNTDPTRKEFDFQFLSEVTDHLMGDLRIAENCAGKKIRPELARFCKQLFTDQTREQEQMVKMLKQWYAKEAHSDPYPLWIESQNGEVFEKYFLEGVLKGHEGIAHKAAVCVKEAKHPELVTLCTGMAKRRAEEAKVMKAWNCEWFKKC